MPDPSRLLVIERILRDRESIWRQIADERDLNELTVDLLASSAVALAAYGAVLGFFHGPLMALTSAVKLPLLFLVTLVICLPTLYLFNLVFGSRVSVRQVVALVMVAVTVTAMLALAFAPVSLFFLVTLRDYGFFKLLNVAILALAAIVGLRFLTGGMQVINEHELTSERAAAAPGSAAAAPESASGAPDPVPSTEEEAEPEPALALVAARAERQPDATTSVVLVPPGPPYTSQGEPPMAYPQISPLPAQAGPPSRPGGFRPGGSRHGGSPTGPRPASMALLYVWIVLFGFVGTQLAWTLRPFFGSPGMEFALFRPIEGNFYAEILRTIAHL